MANSVHHSTQLQIKTFYTTWCRELRAALNNGEKMKRTKSIALTALMILGFVFSMNAQQVFRTTSKSVIPFYQYVPVDYNSNSNKYPVVIFLHGIGERCPNTTDKNILDDYISQVAK